MVVSRPRLYFHIGVPKTGTTYIQDLLWINRTKLLEGGLYVPGDRQLDHFHVERDIREDHQPHNHPEPRWEGKFDTIVNEIEEAGAPASVISAERLCASTPGQIERTRERLSDFEVHVIYGIRDLASLLTSEWQESVKHRNQLSFQDWLDGLGRHERDEWFWMANDLERTLGNWSTVDPRYTHVLIFPPPGSPTEEVWNRFASALEWTAPVETTSDRPNESLGFLEASLLSRIQSRIPDDAPVARRLTITRAEIAGRILAQRSDRMPILIPEGHREWIARNTEARVAYLEKSDYDVIGDLADLADLDRRFGESTTDGHELETLDASLEVIGDLVVMLSHERDRADRLQARIAEMEAAPPRRNHVSALKARIPSSWRSALTRR